MGSVGARSRPRGSSTVRRGSPSRRRTRASAPCGPRSRPPVSGRGMSRFSTTRTARAVRRGTMQREDSADAAWVAALTGSTLARAEKSIDEARADRPLFGHLAREHRSEGREHYGEIDAPLELYAIVRLRRPRHVLEVGVSYGVSSAYLLRALERNRQGTLHSIDR